VRTRKVPGFNTPSWRRTLATLWVLFAVGIGVAWPQDSPSNPKMLARYLEFLPLAESPVSHVRLDSKLPISEVSLAPSVQGRIDILQTVRTPRFLLAGFRVDDIDPASSIPPEQKVDAFDGGCANSSAWGQTATLLPDGSLLLVGGLAQTGPVTAAFIETPGSNQPTRLGTVLNFPRAWHTSTLLPDGNVLVFGGLDSAGKVVTAPELFDPSASTFNQLRTPGPTPRAYHSATLLTDGTILIAGGLSSDGVLLSNAELWDPRTGVRTTLAAELSVPRRNHCAVLLPTGKVLLWGGTNAGGERLNNGDLYDPEAQSFSLVDTIPAEAQASAEGPILVASKPENGAQNIPAARDNRAAIFGIPQRSNRQLKHGKSQRAARKNADQSRSSRAGHTRLCYFRPAIAFRYQLLATTRRPHRCRQSSAPPDANCFHNSLCPYRSQ